MTREQLREYRSRCEDFKRKLTDLLVDYNAHIYVNDTEDNHIDTTTFGIYCSGEFDIDYKQPIGEKDEHKDIP